LMEESAFEAENDISSLSVSFLTVQCIRFALTEQLPNEEGLDKVPEDQLGMAAAWIIGIGFMFAIVACTLVTVQAKMGHSHGELEKEKSAEKEPLAHEEADGLNEAPISPLQRLVMIGLNATAMSFAWCILWGTRWLFELMHPFPEKIMCRVVMALLLSAAAGLAVFALDIVDDAHSGAEDSRSGAQAIQMLVNALGILVGFSWEHCFDGSVMAVASQTANPVLAKFLLGLIIAASFVPVWRQHILTKEIIYQKMKEDKEEAATVRRKEQE